MKEPHNNPLLETQRETSGASTFSKYLYQYHYGLYMALMKHDTNVQYAVVMEYHEDVIFINSLDSSVAKYSFNQVKSLKSKMSETDLIKLKNDKSVLGKIISSCTNKKYSENIEEINIISEKGFSFKDNKLNVTKFQFSNFSESVRSDLENKLRKELGNPDFKIPDNIYFICPDIKEVSCRDTLHVLIGETVKRIYGDVFSKVSEIYTTLIDEMYRKGRVTENYHEWDDFIKMKALTSDKINNVIQMFIFDERRKNEEKDLEDILNEFRFNFIKKREFKEYFKRYKTNRIANDIYHFDIKQDINEKLNIYYSSNTLSIIELIEKVYENLDPKIISKFSAELDVKAAIICEYLNR